VRAAAAIAALKWAVAPEARPGITGAADLDSALRLNAGAFAFVGGCICRRTDTIDNDSEQQNEGRALHGDVPPIGILIFSAEAERRPDAPRDHRRDISLSQNHLNASGLTGEIVWIKRRLAIR
jgi:hypothetical protein